MNATVTTSRKVIWTVLGAGIVLALLMGLSLRGRLNQYNSIPMYGAVPNFSLIQQDGKPLTKQDLLGNVWIADFIFSRCGGQCPTMSTVVAGLQSDMAGHNGLRFVSFSVDPAFDTPEVLAQYAAKYHADPKRWIFVTGDKEKLFDLARKGFLLGVDNNSPDAPNYAVEPVFHSSRLALVDAQGNIRGYYEAMDPQALKGLRKHAAKLVKEIPKAQ